MNLNYKLLIMAAALVLYTSGSLFFIANYAARKNLKAQIITDLSERSKVKIKNIDRFIQQLQSDILMAAQNPILRNRQSFSTEELNALLNSLTQINSLYYSYSFFDTNRTRLADSKGLSVGGRHSYSKYWKEIDFKNPSKKFLLDFSLSESIGKVVIHSACIVFNNKGKPIGLLVSRVLVDRLYDVFSENDESLRRLKGQIDLLNSKGNILYSSAASKNMFGAPYKEVSVSSILGNQSNAVYESDKKLYLIEQDKGYLNYYGKGFVLIFSLPVESAFLPLRNLENNLIIVLAITLLVSAGITLWVTKIITRPLIAITKTAKEIANGNLEASFILRSKDEFETLGLQLQKMAKTLRNRLKAQTTLSEELLFKNNQITDSIRFAKGLLDSYQPNDITWKKYFKNHFIINLPKDILGGDFYYLKERNGKVIWVLGDCTGHGVAGALMVVQAYNALVQLIEVEGVTSAQELLHQLEEKLIAKNEDMEENNLYSGLDIGICVFDMANKTISFSGIGLDLMSWQNETFLYIKGVKRNYSSKINSIASLQSERQFGFETGHRFYMATDGFKDQIGGEKGRKLMKTGLETKLKTIQFRDISEQGHHLKSFIMDWMAFEPQLDDILVIGLEI